MRGRRLPDAAVALEEADAGPEPPPEADGNGLATGIGDVWIVVGGYRPSAELSRRGVVSGLPWWYWEDDDPDADADVGREPWRAE